jgi:ectoine hydroxylase-related dioxygenase (phytanoyl-CoA dioxygenase family)
LNLTTSKNFPDTASVFGSEWIENICNRCLGSESVLNHDSFLVHDVTTSMQVALDSHYNKTPTLKFFIYLTDTTSENSSFYCVPESHKYTKKLQDKNRIELKNPKHSETKFVPLEFQSEQIP